MNATANTTNATRMGGHLAAQRAAFLRDGSPSLAQRRSDPAKFRATIIGHRKAIEDAINADFGHRSRYETAIMEVGGVAEGTKYLISNLRRFMAPTRRHVALHMRMGKARVEYQPLGVVGVMSPWNYPVNLALMPVATALAAGNRVMLKPSEFTPVTNALLAKMFGEMFSEDQFAIVTSDAAVGAAFSAMPFDHLVFTGSTEVGRAVMKAASDNLVPVTLELGGKSPVIVAQGYSLDQAAASIAFGKLLNAGQTCIAPDYAFVHEDDIDSFVGTYDRKVASFYADGPTSEHYTSIINERHHARLQGLIEDASAKGARIIKVGNRPGDASRHPNTLVPTVVLGVTDTMRIAHEEIFGPVLPIFPYRDVEEVIAYVNARPRPLALYYFGADDEDRRMVLSRTTSGNVTINGTIMHIAQDDLPFGGVGASGMGAYHGIEGFRTLSHAKGIYEQGRWNLSNLLHAPFRQPIDFILNVMLR
ncbi:coniferyl-aldehyde dehydrogenase [Rhizobium azibense]|nr:coniferyl-aldehyde dehydrogenase [Rhizobium azibense]